jgi:glycine dehydrogenase subunit 2
MKNATLPSIHDISRPGRRGPKLPVASADRRAKARRHLPNHLQRKSALNLPEVSELDTVRHFTRLSQRNYAIDAQFYPLGSCTMKYNPKVNDQIANWPGFAALHPMQDDRDAQGTLRCLALLQSHLETLLGMSGVSLAPAAGAQGEYAGMAIIKAFYEQRGEAEQRRVVLVPDSAHGTNPASAALAGFKVKTIKTDNHGRVDLEALKAALDPSVAGLMLTNPNTCGVFERDIIEIARLVHEAGAQLYYDGANLNAIVGRHRPGDMGFDVVHVNLHKTFSTPHGGGGPGAGPVGVAKHLKPFLPEPHLVQDGEGHIRLRTNNEQSIGKLMAFHGNVGVHLRALAYILAQGSDGLKQVAEMAVLNANYVLANLPDAFEQPFERPCKHEALVSVRKAKKEQGITAFDVAKRLLDLGYHAPTIYFPLLVAECLLIEPTETESKETLDQFIAAMHQIADEMANNPDLLKNAPNDLLLSRLDDVKAAKELNVCCRWDDGDADCDSD